MGSGINFLSFSLPDSFRCGADTCQVQVSGGHCEPEERLLQGKHVASFLTLTQQHSVDSGAVVSTQNY